MVAATKRYNALDMTGNGISEVLDPVLAQDAATKHYVDLHPGTVGPAGPTGPAGTPGSVWRNGSGAPSNALGVNGDYYLNNTTGDVYLKTSGTYSIVANIKGAPGTTGATGSTGATGPAGSTGAPGTPGEAWWTGTVSPGTGTGIDGDWYLNNATGDIYEKVSGTWVSRGNLRGPAGPTGATGSPGSATNGIAPSTSPVPVVTPGIGELFVAWGAITNVDPVTYELHVSVTTGFTPGPTTLALKTSATQAVLKTLPSGSPIAYGITYYIKVVATDGDGAGPASAEASGTPAQVNTPDIAASSITADQIVVDSILAAQIASLLLVAGTIETATSGQRVVIDSGGIHLYDAAGNEMVSIPTDPNQQPTFRGSVITGGLTVTDSMLIQGATNQMDKGAVLTLISQLASPVASPTLAFEYDTTGPFVTGVTGLHGLDYTAAGGAGGTSAVYYTVMLVSGTWTLHECRQSDSAVLRTKTVGASNTYSIAGVAQVGSYVFVCRYLLNTDGIQVVPYDLATLTAGTAITITHSNIGATGLQGNLAAFGFGTDGTNLLFVAASAFTGTSPWQVAKYSVSGATITYVNTTTLTGGLAYPAIPMGITGRGSDWATVGLVTATPTVSVYELYNPATGAKRTTTGHTWAPDCVNPAGNATINCYGGVAYDGSAYHGARATFPTVLNFSPWVWTPGTNSDTFWYGYTWYASGGPNETKISPRVSIQLNGASPTIGRSSSTYQAMRGQVRVVSPALPGGSGVTDAHVYALFSASSPVVTSMLLQTSSGTSNTLTTRTTYVRNYYTGAAYVDTNTFPGAGGGAANPTIKAAGSGHTAPWQLGGDDTFLLPRFTLAQRLAAPAKAQLQWNEDRNYMEIWNGTRYTTTHDRSEQAIDDAINSLAGISSNAAYPIAETLVDRGAAVATTFTDTRLVGVAFTVRREVSALYIAPYVLTTAGGLVGGWCGCSLWQMNATGDWTWLADTGANKVSLYNSLGLNFGRLRDFADTVNVSIPLYPGNVYIASACAKISSGTLQIAMAPATGVLNGAVSGTAYARCGGLSAITTRRTTDIPVASMAPFANVPWLGVYGTT